MPKKAHLIAGSQRTIFSENFLKILAKKIFPPKKSFFNQIRPQKN